jgi:hypothetical protein
MPRQVKDHFEAVMYSATLRKIAERVQLDYDRAYERGDIVRGLRHARRIDMVEYAILANGSCEISSFSSFN